MGYTNTGASDSQFYPHEPAIVWRAVQHALQHTKVRSRSDSTMRMECNLGMSGITGNVIATVSVQPALGGGSSVKFDGRMGVMSSGQFGGPRRIEKERTTLFDRIASVLPAAPQPTGGSSVADELTKLARLRDSGALSTAEFEQQKRRLLGG